MGSYRWGPQALIAPFAGLDAVWNVCLAPWLLKEKLNAPRIYGSVLIGMAAMATSIFASKSDPDYTLDYVLQEAVTWRTISFYVLYCAVIAVNSLICMRGEQCALCGKGLQEAGYQAPEGVEKMADEHEEKQEYMRRKKYFNFFVVHY